MSGTPANSEGLAIEIEQPRDEVALARFTGQAGVEQADLLERYLKILAKRPESLLVLDLSCLTFVSSVGISALMQLQKSVESRGATMRISGLTPTILGALRRCKLDKHFTTFPTSAEALRA
jgi:anti-anti-sigma factor